MLSILLLYPYNDLLQPKAAVDLALRELSIEHDFPKWLIDCFSRSLPKPSTLTTRTTGKRQIFHEDEVGRSTGGAFQIIPLFIQIAKFKTLPANITEVGARIFSQYFGDFLLSQFAKFPLDESQNLVKPT